MDRRTILFVDSMLAHYRLFVQELQEAGCSVAGFQNPSEAKAAMSNGLEYCLAIIEPFMGFQESGLDGIDLIRQSKERHPYVPIIAYSRMLDAVPEADVDLKKAYVSASEVVEMVGRYLDV